MNMFINTQKIICSDFTDPCKIFEENFGNKDEKIDFFDLCIEKISNLIFQMKMTIFSKFTIKKFI